MRLCLVLLISCAAAQKPTAADSLPEEVHLKDLRRMTHGGENAEAYWAFDGKKLSMQTRGPKESCDRIYSMDAATGALTQLSSGQGATTCSHFLPDGSLIYASTHLGGEACPKRPDMSQGYVWALYRDYDIFKTTPQGLQRLTDTPGYDAEGTVCGKDGSIIFTSVRDGDLELYRMDADGKNVKRLTNAPGYDGGAFFNADCTKFVWRAARPKGAELEEYKNLLAQGLVRPTKLEIWVANADGSEAQQVTYLNAASFAPFFFPDSKRILFSSNYGDPKGREFDIFAINVDGTQLERITHAPGFDGFPMFSPDGKTLAFSSNRGFPPGSHETDVYLARWEPGAPQALQETAADRIQRDVAWLADPAREGRGVGLVGLEQSGAYVEQRFQKLGLQAAGEEGTFRQFFDVPVSASAEAVITVGGVNAEKIAVPGFSASGTVDGTVVLAGYGLPEDYEKLDVKGKIALVRRFVPDDPKYAGTEAQRRFGDLRFKAFTARERGAKALLVVDWPAGAKELPSEAALPGTHAEGPGDAGIPVAVIQRAAAAPAMEKPVLSHLRIHLTVQRKPAFNVLGRLVSKSQSKLPGVVLIGAHYDHLGMGGRYSLTPDLNTPHLGADDNASGVAAVLEAARSLAEHPEKLQRDVIFAAFSAEESGIIGSSHFARSKLNDGLVAMINLDMVGRLRGNRLTALGSNSAPEWAGLVEEACAAAHLECTESGDGYGPSDHTSFYAAGIPVLHFFTGAHSDYHKPSDDVAHLNAGGAAQTAQVVAQVAASVANRTEKLTYNKIPSPAPQGDLRSFNASLGTVPDYAGPPNGQKGMLLSAVRPGGAADQAGLKRGDILIQLGTHRIDGVEDLMYVLNASKPGETVRATVLRDGKEVTLEATFQEAKRAR